MSARRAIGIGVSCFFLLAAGCSQIEGLFGQSSSPPPAVSNPPPSADANDAPAPDALAAKVKTYTDELAPHLHEHHADAIADTPATQPATQPVEAATDEIPSSMALSPFQPETSPPPTVAPVAPSPSAPQANAIAPPTNDANFPMTVPEHADADTAALPAADTSGGLDTTSWSSDQLGRKLARHIQDYPKDLEGQLDYELLMFIQEQPVPDMTAMSGLSAEDREVLAAIMDGLSNFRSVVHNDSNALLGSKVKPLLDMSDRLRSQAELTLNSLVLCSQVKSYGVYVPMDPPRFAAGQANETIVYCEVQNFQSQLTGENQWQTKLTEEMTLYTESGQQVWPDKSDPQPVTDLCRERRHDFFIAKLVTLPQELAA
ncbi:MAG TPA: hypothetical protein VL992_04760, partial [Tepidisphaeraceae bacterium]|nr:hypothetical protein [Tepidisphaeraceae bacterium]